MDLNLVYISVIGFFVVIGLVSVVLIKLDEKVEPETRKVRMAAAILTGILIILVIAVTMYFSVDPTNAGPIIFDKLLTTMSPIIGAILGYFFAKPTA